MNKSPSGTVRITVGSSSELSVVNLCVVSSMTSDCLFSGSLGHLISISIIPNDSYNNCLCNLFLLTVNKCNKYRILVDAGSDFTELVCGVFNEFFIGSFHHLSKIIYNDIAFALHMKIVQFVLSHRAAHQTFHLMKTTRNNYYLSGILKMFLCDDRFAGWCCILDHKSFQY